MLGTAINNVQRLTAGLFQALDFRNFAWSNKNVDGPTRPYLKPVAWIAEKDGLQQTPIAVVFPLSDGQYAYVEWDKAEKRYSYESAHYITNPDPVLTAVKSRPNTLFTSNFDVDTRVVLGFNLPPAVWQSLQDAAEGPTSSTQPLTAKLA